jgi:uncharacterized protein YcnI
MIHDRNLFLLWYGADSLHVFLKVLSALLAGAHLTFSSSSANKKTWVAYELFPALVEVPVRAV